MGSYVALHNRVYLGPLDMSGFSNRVNFGTLTRQMKDSTTYNDGGYMCVKPGLINGEASIDFRQDWDPSGVDETMSVGQLGSQYPLMVVPNPTGTVTAGDPCSFSRGLLGSLNPGMVLKGEMAQGAFTFPYDTAICQQAKVLHPKAARTADGSGTAVAMTGPTSAQRLYAALHVFAYSGFTSVAFTIETDDSSGFSSATTRISFDSVTGVTSQFKSVAGAFASETHVRVSWDVTGSGSVTFACGAAVL